MKKLFTLVVLLTLSAIVYGQGGLGTRVVAGANITVNQAGNTYTVSAGASSGGTVTSVTVTPSASGISGTVTNPTTTPAISLSVTATGSGSFVKQDAPAIASPTVTTALTVNGDVGINCSTFGSTSTTDDCISSIGQNNLEIILTVTPPDNRISGVIQLDSNFVNISAGSASHYAFMYIDTASINMNPQGTTTGSRIFLDTGKVIIEASGSGAGNDYTIEVDTNQIVITGIPTYTSQAAANAALGVGVLVKINSASPAIKYLYLTEFYDEDFYATEEKYFYFRRNKFLK